MDLRSGSRVQVRQRPDSGVHQPAPAQPESVKRIQNRISRKQMALLCGILLLLIGGLVVFYILNDPMKEVKGNQYQAVFLTNGQVYFGKISHLSPETVRMHDIYYLQQSANVQSQNDKDQPGQSQLTLTKLGKELHGPEDIMHIERSQMLFWENIANDSQVAQSIKKEKSQNN